MQSQSLSNNYIDYFKLFKVFDLKKIQKTGQVKIVQDKILSRKIVSVEGNISTSNFMTFSTSNYSNISFSERYLYIQGFVDAGKSFCIQLSFMLGGKGYKAVMSTLYKIPKKHQDNVIHLPIKMNPNVWTIVVLDLYELGEHFQAKVNEIKLTFKLTSVQIRASSKVKGLFQSDYLFSINKIPKEMSFPLRADQNYYDKYQFIVQNQEIKQVQESTPSEQKSNMKINQNSRSNPIVKGQDIQKRKSIKSQQNKNRTQKGKKIGDTMSREKKQKPKEEKFKKDKVHEKEQGKRIDKSIDFDQNQLEDKLLQPPKPLETISFQLSCIEGFSISNGVLSTVESFIVKPIILPTHKSIQLIKQVPGNKIKLLVGYNDGSLCMWHTVRRQPLFYFKTEIWELRQALIDHNDCIILVGLDKLKREVINIINGNQVVFRQISNYNIHKILMVREQNFEDGLLSFGYENIRLWRVNNSSSTINGVNIYLGQTNRKVKYNAGIIVNQKDDSLAFIAGSNGFITTISIKESKMLQTLKLDDHGIDEMVRLSSNKIVKAVISNDQGQIKIINLQRMQVIQEYSLSCRVKEIVQLQNSNQLMLNHFNKTIGCLNLDSSLYTFSVRSHVGEITKLAYCQYYNKLVSVGRDSTIRIWQYIKDQSGLMPFRFQEQYQFLINGEQIVGLVVGQEVSGQNANFVYVGADSGKIRKIDIEKYEIKQQIQLQQGFLSISISKNGKFILATYESGNTYLLDNNFDLIHKYTVGDWKQSKKVKYYVNGFNKTNREYFIENCERGTVDFYSFKQKNQPMFSIKFASKITCIIFIENMIYASTLSEIYIYESQSPVKVIPLNGIELSNRDALCMNFPLVCYATQCRIFLLVLLRNKVLSEFVDLPEPVHNLSFSNSNSQEGMIFCSGKSSHAIYSLTYHVRNIHSLLEDQLTLNKYEVSMQQYDSEISFSKQSRHIIQNKSQPNFNHQQRAIDEPKELRRLYEEEEKIYEQVKDYLFPYDNDENTIEQCQNQPQNVEQQLEVSKESRLSLIYGFDLEQGSKERMGFFSWINKNKSLILITNNNKSIVQHFFAVPIKQKIISFVSKITSLCVGDKQRQGVIYMCVATNNIIKVYNVFEGISFMKSFDSFLNACPKNVMFQMSITPCNGFIVGLSYNSTVWDDKIFIHIIQILSGNIVSSSYLTLPQPKNKYKARNHEQIERYRLAVNSYKNSLQFIIYNSEGCLHFYRMTSIFTLQTIQIEELKILCRDKVSDITSACFLSIEQDEIILALGSINGSIVFIDCRTATILIACVNIISSCIRGLSFARVVQKDDFSQLILYSNSNYITLFNLQYGLHSILQSMKEITSHSTQTNISNSSKQIMTVDGEINSYSTMSESKQQLIITKCGSLWLIDYTDLVTVKVLSFHTSEINQAEIIICPSTKQKYLFTCSNDSSAKLSCLQNLQQSIQIFKPRKQAKAFSLEGLYSVFAFNDQVYIYDKIFGQNGKQQQINNLGSFKVDMEIISIKNIPQTSNYYIITERQIIIFYIKSKANRGLTTTSRISSQKSNLIKKIDEVYVEMQPIAQVNNATGIQVNQLYAPYDQFAVCLKPGKINVWSRKCLKRNQNPLEQLSKVHELTYYLIDSYNKNTTQSNYVKFVSECEYVCAIYDEGIIQIRNFKEHVVSKEINLSVQNICCMSIMGEQLFMFYFCDSLGYFYVANQNGLILDRLKAFEGKPKNMQLLNHKKNKLSAIVYGSQYVSIIDYLPFNP